MQYEEIYVSANFKSDRERSGRWESEPSVLLLPGPSPGSFRELPTPCQVYKEEAETVKSVHL